MIKEVRDSNNIKNLLSPPHKAPMMQARRQSLLCYNDIKSVLVEGLGQTSAAFKIFSYFISAANQNTMTYSLFINEERKILVYRIDEWARAQLAEKAMKGEKIDDFGIKTKVFLMEKEDYEEGLKAFRAFGERMDRIFAFKIGNHKILDQKLFLVLDNYTKSLEVSNPYGNVEFTENVNWFLAKMDALVKVNNSSSNLSFEFYY